MFHYIPSLDLFLYGFLNNLGAILLCIFNLLHIKKKRQIPSRLTKAIINITPQKKGHIYAELFFNLIEIFLISGLQIAMGGLINSWFGDLCGTGVNYFGTLFISPALIFVFCIIVGLDVFKQFDLIAPAYPLALTTIKLACFCQGCCHGIAFDHGLYNHITKQLEFPVQLIEAVFAFLIFVFLMKYKKKAKEGTLLPLFVILYSVTRFFSEFLRFEENVFWYFKTYHLLCLVGIVVGLIELLIVIIVNKKRDKKAKTTQ